MGRASLAEGRQRPLQENHGRVGGTAFDCRIGERSSHSWFVLTYLLAHGNTKNYDGSWTEWGNQVGAPVATGPA